MKKLVSDILVAETIRKFSPQMQGVFSTADLHNLIGTGSKLTNQRVITRLGKSGILTRCQRGFFVTEPFNLWLLASRIQKNSYVSMDSVLSTNGLVGVVANQNVSAITFGRAQSLKIKNKRIDYYQASRELFFGFAVKKGIAIADNEKAFLDLLYYHLRGYRFAFDPRSEIDLDQLDKNRLNHYLKKYRNPKFVSFAKGVAYGR
jgi:predicted transcriptional regulator of viral defense system